MEALLIVQWNVAGVPFVDQRVAFIHHSDVNGWVEEGENGGCRSALGRKDVRLPSVRILFVDKKLAIGFEKE